MDIYEQISRDEGNRLKPYLDCCGEFWRDCTCTPRFKGKLTIGRGRNLEDRGITAGESFTMFHVDVQTHRNEVNECYPWAAGKLNDARYAVLVNLCYNMGIGRLMGFKKMIAAIRQENWQAAHDELLDSFYARQVGDRAHRLAGQLLTGQWK